MIIIQMIIYYIFYLASHLLVLFFVVVLVVLVAINTQKLAHTHTRTHINVHPTYLLHPFFYSRGFWVCLLVVIVNIFNFAYLSIYQDCIILFFYLIGTIFCVFLFLYVFLVLWFLRSSTNLCQCLGKYFFIYIFCVYTLYKISVFFLMHANLINIKRVIDKKNVERMDWSKSKNKKLRYSKFLLSIISIVHHSIMVLFCSSSSSSFFFSIAHNALPLSLFLNLSWLLCSSETIDNNWHQHQQFYFFIFICYCCSCFQVGFSFLITFFIIHLLLNSFCFFSY